MQKGIGAIYILVILALLILAGSVGYVYMQPEKEVPKPFESKMTKGIEVGITDKQKLVTALVQKDYDAISNLLGDSITWVLEASECCGDIDRDEALKRVRQKLEAQQYQFNQESPTIVAVREYFKKYPKFGICSQSNVIVIGVMDDHALTFCTKNGRVQMIREASTLREYGIVATEEMKETGNLSLPISCINGQEGMPVITSLSSYFGSIGTKLEIDGCNFLGFEGNKNAWIENSQGIAGILRIETGSTGKLLKVTLKSPLCQNDTSYSGLPCGSWVDLIPGTYKIYTMPWGKKSNEVSFTIQ